MGQRKGGQYQCDWCTKGFSSLDDLHRHRKLCRSVEARNSRESEGVVYAQSAAIDTALRFLKDGERP